MHTWSFWRDITAFKHFCLWGAGIADIESGALRAYLEHGVVGARVGNTLFVHGAVDALNMGFVPEDRLRALFVFSRPSVPDPVFTYLKRFMF